MPYIKQRQRDRLVGVVKAFTENTPYDAGELNYLVSKLVLTYVGRIGEGYQAYNDVIGALEGAKLEVYRRQLATYEDKKIADNGEI